MRLPIRRTALATLAALMGLSAAATTAMAQANCVMYGKLAIQQQKENVQRKCGFTGPAWSENLRAHISWCGTVGPGQWKTELQRRDSMLKTECSK